MSRDEKDAPPMPANSGPMDTRLKEYLQGLEANTATSDGPQALHPIRTVAFWDKTFGADLRAVSHPGRREVLQRIRRVCLTRSRDNLDSYFLLFAASEQGMPLNASCFCRLLE